MSRNARDAVNQAIAQAAKHFPDIPLIEPDLAGLSEADARLADAIFRLTLRRWLTLEHVVNRFSRRPLNKLSPAVQASLLTGAAQILLMDRLPAYAVVDQAIRSVRKAGQGDATGLVNAVLRKVSDLDPVAEPGYVSARDLLPDGTGNSIRINRPLLPSTDNLLAHLSIAASIPLALLQSWFKHHGSAAASSIALHSITQPPIFFTDEQGSRVWQPDQGPIPELLSRNPGLVVQDPTAAQAVRATARVNPETIYDACAGRGTKTRQLRQLHPAATVTAWDPSDDRRAELEKLDGVQVRQPNIQECFDLVVLDVPCSNTGVLARRPAARYRYSAKSVKSLVLLQREIVEKALPHLAESGSLLYTTCSIDPAENQQQTAWISQRLAETHRLVEEKTTLPQGSGLTSHDGGYHGLFEAPDRGSPKRDRQA